MIRLTRSPDCLSHHDDGYPCECVMLTASRIANILPPAERRDGVRRLLEEHCSDLGSSDREELLEDIFARRARSRGDFPEGMGLLPDRNIPGRFLPGSWFLNGERSGHCFTFTIRGVYAADGRMVSVPLTSKQFLKTEATLRAVKRAVGAEGQIIIATAEWRCIWNGFEQRDGGGSWRWVVGLRYLLHQDFVRREERFHATY